MFVCACLFVFVYCYVCLCVIVRVSVFALVFCVSCVPWCLFASLCLWLCAVVSVLVCV